MINYDLSVHTGSITLRELAERYRTGKYISFAKWLQRLEQEKKWCNNHRRNARAYLQRLLQTKGPIQGFLVCDIGFLIENIKEQQEEKPNLIALWQEMADWLVDAQNKGAEFVILDGQNRLRYAINKFIFGDLSISLNIDGQERGNVLYKDLDFDTQQQVNEHPVLLSVAHNGNVTSVVEQLIAINEGEPWSEHERRCVLLTPVAYHINKITSHPDVVKFMTKLDSLGILTTNYALHKKGDSLYIAEYLHYLRNGKLGSKSSLTKLYHANDEDLDQQLRDTNEMFLWIVRNFPKKFLNKNKNLTKESIRDIILFTTMLINKDVPSASEVAYSIKLKQIKTPAVYLEKMVEVLQKMLADKSQIEPFEDKNGNIVYKTANAKPGSFLSHHKNSSEADLRGRVRHFIKPFNEILDECVANGSIITKDPRKVTKADKMQAAVKFKGDPNERFGTENLISLQGMELDHIKSVKNGGGSDIDNLEYTSKSNNRKMGGK